MSSKTLPEALFRSVHRGPDQIAIKTSTATMTYAELLAVVRTVAKGLMALGLEHGDRIAVWAVNRMEWPIAGFAIQAIGGVIVPISTRLKGAEAAAILRRARVRAVITDPGFGQYDFVKALAAESLPDLSRIIVFDDRVGGGGVLSWDQLQRLSSEISDEALDRRTASVGPDDLCDIIYTSGTTGAPKGVPVRHAQSLESAAAYQQIINLSASDTLGVIYPFAHNAGYRAGWQIALLHGARLAPVTSYDPLDILQLIARERVSVFPAVPTLYQSLIDCPQRQDFDLSSLRIASTGAAVVPVPLVKRMRTDLGAGAVLTGYGLTEACGTVTHCRVGDDDETVALTAGRAMPGLEVLCVDGDHRPVGVGETGEIAVCGAVVLDGYFEDPAATAKAFTADGFLLTGDVGVFDARGNLKITDRLKDMYIVGGFNCYPAEIEHQLRNLPGIADVAVIGIDDQRLGQVGRAFVVRAPGSALDAQAVIAYARDSMANYKAPRSVIFVDQLPLNATGKVAKDVLRALPA